MYLFMVTSSIFIGYMIVYSCCMKNKEYEIYDDNKYLRNVDLLQYFSESKNMERLEKILDNKNGILEKVKNLININNEIREDFENEQEITNLEVDPKIKYGIEINNKIVVTSMSQLEFIRWILENDYMLHID